MIFILLLNQFLNLNIMAVSAAPSRGGSQSSYNLVERAVNQILSPGGMMNQTGRTLFVSAPLALASVPEGGGTAMDPIDPTTIPQFVDPLPHFAGMRVDAKAGGKLIIKAVPHQQIALSTGTVMDGNKAIGSADPSVGLGNFWTYSISKDGGSTWTPPLWPAVTVEASVGKAISVEYRNELFGQTYKSINLVVDQTVHWAMPEMTADPYSGPVPIVPHLHGGEVPSESDGGPYAWFTPGKAKVGPTWGIDGTDENYNYPNTQEAATLWYHDHAMGATRLNVYAGLAGYYWLRGADEENSHLPGWSGDDLVKEIAPAGTTGTFNSNPYLPELELAIQDRMFNNLGGLYWPNDPPNPEVHPFWTPEFFGDVMCVNGKSWPYLSVAPRKYRFRVLDGCNARFLNMWLEDQSGKKGPAIQVIGTDGGLLDKAVVKDPDKDETLFIAPGERYDIVIDFSSVAPGTVLTLKNDANAPYPDGDAVIEGLTDRIMQFVVNGEKRSAADPAASGNDKSSVSGNLRAVPTVKLTNYAGTANVTPTKKRQLTLNEIHTDAGPLEVLVNNSHYDLNGMAPTAGVFGDVTENPKEGATELVTIINTTVDAHPMHFHLVQFQLVSRQEFDAETYEKVYEKAFKGGTFLPQSGSPMPYDSLNADGAVGGNPAVTPFLKGTVLPARPEEMGWKDTYKVFPGQVATFIIRYAPTDLPATTAAKDLHFGFDPSKGPGYVWHCHIVDHEDNEMMRPDYIEPSSFRDEQVALNSTGNVYSAPAGMKNYKWNIPAGGVVTAGGTANDPTVTITWNILGEKLLKVFYTSNAGGIDYPLSIPSTFPVNVNPLPALNGAASACAKSTGNVYTTDPGMSNYVWSVTGGTITSGGTSTSNTATITWNAAGPQTVSVNYMNANGFTSNSPTQKSVTVNPVPATAGAITGIATVCAGTQGVAYSVTSITDATSYVWTVPAGAVIASGAGTNSITVNYGTSATSGNVTVSGSNGCGSGTVSNLAVTVNPLVAAAGNITGPSAVCQGSTGVILSVAPIANATSYTWSLPAGASISSGASTNSILVNLSMSTVSGPVTVYGSNSCGNGSTSPAFTLIINVIPANPLVTATGSNIVSNTLNGNQWYFSDTANGAGAAISGATNQIYTPAQNGYYWSVVTLNGCSSGDSNHLFRLKAGESNRYNVFPVPNNGEFTVSVMTPDDQVFTIQIFDQVGHKIYDQPGVRINGEFKQSINLQPVNTGTYMVVIRGKDGNVIKRFSIFK